MSTSHRKRALILLGIATVAFTVILEVIDPSHVSHGPTILDELLGLVKLQPGDLDLLTAGPPCQGLSKIGTRQLDDERTCS